MSGIFGFHLLNSGLEQAYLAPLEYWNRMYGNNGSETKVFDAVGFGCHLEHLANHYDCAAPIIHHDNQYAIIDAILYNRDEIMTELGVDYNSRFSDEELLLTYITKLGYQALANVNGDFSGAVYDTVEKTWCLFRDHSGIRPLFYYQDERVFAFSTDMRGLSSLPGADMQINEKRFYLEACGFNELSLRETHYHRIRCIHPATYTTISLHNGSFAVHEYPYWKWNSKKIRLGSDKEYQAELRRLITDAIQRRLDAFDGLVGCELSGGLDSSVIAILINRLGRKGCYHSWSYNEDITPLNDGRDERKVIRDICEQENIECHFSGKDDVPELSEQLKKLEPPYINSRVLRTGAQYMREQGARVVFTGHGGDEGVSHRCTAFELFYHGEYLKYLRIMYQDTYGLNLRPLRTLKNVGIHLRNQLRMLNTPYHNLTTDFSHFLNPVFLERMKGSVTPSMLTFGYDPVTYIMQGGQRGRLDNTAYQGAEAGVRYMLPFLDYRVLDYALSIPRYLYLNGNQSRYIYRKAFEDICPESLLKVNYKDTPSKSSFVYPKDFSDIFLIRKNGLLGCLDPVIWEAYLDFDKLRSFTIPKHYTLQDWNRGISFMHHIADCCYIQNVAVNSSSWNHNNEHL